MKKIVSSTSEDEHRGNTKTSHQQWTTAAIELLINEGAAAVKVDRLAKILGVTRGGFYWFFKNRNDLLDQLVDSWRLTENDPLTACLRNSNKGPIDTLALLLILIVQERKYNPLLDSAMRDWARTSKRVRTAIDEVDERRIAALSDVYENLCESPETALIRAQIFYYHQIGYYAMEVKEGQQERYSHIPIYFKLLTGYDVPDWVIERLKP